MQKSSHLDCKWEVPKVWQAVTTPLLGVLLGAGMEQTTMLNCRLVIKLPYVIAVVQKNISDVKDIHSICKVRCQPFLRVFRDRLFVQLLTETNMRFGLCSKFCNAGISCPSRLVPLDHTD